MDGDEDDTSAVFVPKKSNLSRQAIEKISQKRAQITLSSNHLPSRHEPSQPSYSADILSELKASTPSLPQDLLSKSDFPTPDNEHHELDLASKFGTDLALHQTSAIPTDAEIKEKKDRRARLAKEQEFISLDSDDQGDKHADDSDSTSSSNHDASILPYTGPKRQKEGPSRLAQDGDELGEGFDAFTAPDADLALSKKARHQQRQQRKEAMKAQILDAQASDSASSNDSDIERRNAYEATQTRKGMDGLKKVGEEEIKPTRPRTPPRIRPLPTMHGVLERLREKKAAREVEAKVAKKKLEAVRKELADIETRKVEVQKLMSEAGERYEKLRAEVEAEGEGTGRMVKAEQGGLGAGMGFTMGNNTTQGPGLESMGTIS